MLLDRKVGPCGLLVVMIILIFFHNFTNYRKNLNSIWNIVDDNGIIVEGFDNIGAAGVNHIGTLFHYDNNLSLPDIMKIAQNFPTSVSKEENDDLMASVTINELQLFYPYAKMI